MPVLCGIQHPYSVNRRGVGCHGCPTAPLPPGPVYHLQLQDGLQPLTLLGLQRDVHSALPQRVNLAA